MDEHLVFLALAKRREDVAHHGILEGDDIEVGIITYLFDIRDRSPSSNVRQEGCRFQSSAKHLNDVMASRQERLAEVGG